MLEIFIEPDSSLFFKLSKRPEQNQVELTSKIKEIFDDVNNFGDEALRSFTLKFDQVVLKEIDININHIDINTIPLDMELKAAIQTAFDNIYKFHFAQITTPIKIQTMEGIVCEQKAVPIQKVGIYIPGGSAPLFSSVLMLAIPAIIAGCKDIILCTPPDKEGQINPVILYTALLCKVSQIKLIGGAQAIAALAIGTKSVPKVEKIFGPGNQYVTAAKQYAQNFGVAIDMPAGPSEVLVFADETGIPSFVAADLLAQAEHGADSQVILICKSEEFVNEVNKELKIQLDGLPRKSITEMALFHSKSIVISDTIKAFEFVNSYAPEHLIIASATPHQYLEYIYCAGSVFLGNFCPESAGDYASGTNHTLPTNGWAKSYSGVNLDAFQKKITFQYIDIVGIQNLGPTIITMAEAELLQAHANAVKVRLNQSNN